MRKSLKKLLVAAVATAMTIGSTVSAFAADAVTFTEVTYKFECTTFVGEDTITLDGQSLEWAGTSVKPTYNVTAAGEFEMTFKYEWVDATTGEVTPADAAGFNNIGYLSSANSVANIYKLNEIVINDVAFTFQADATANEGKDAIYQTSTINAADGQMNGFPNIWNAAGQQAVVAKSANGSTINGSSSGMTITWADADLPEEETTPAETTPAGEAETTTATTTTPDTGDSTMVVGMIALAVVASAVVLKKSKVNA